MDTPSKEGQKTTVRDPVQARAIRTKQKIIEAGADLFSGRGYHNVTADEIARAAGVSVGTFYSYFSDKHDLFLAVLDDYVIQCNTFVIEGTNALALARGDDAPSLIMKMVRLLVSVHRAAAHLLNEFLKMSLADEEVKRRLDAVDSRIIALIEGALKQTGIDERRAAPAAFVIYHAGEGVIHQIALDPGQTDEEAVLVELTRLYSAYVKEIL